MPSCPQCPTTAPAPTTTPPPGSTCCLQVRYICQKVSGFSTWVLDMINTVCAPAANCGAFLEICTPTEFTYLQPDGCVCSDPLPALPTPPCPPSCGDPSATTTPPPSTTPPVTTPPATTTTTAPPTTTAPTDPCAACVANAGSASTVGNTCPVTTAAGTSFAPCIPGTSPASWDYLSSLGPGGTLSIHVGFFGGTWQVTVSSTNGAGGATSSWQGTYAVGALSCTGATLTGTVNVPFQSQIGAGCGTGTLTVTFS